MTDILEPLQELARTMAADGFRRCARELESLIPAIEKAVAALKEPMSCKHPKACLVEQAHRVMQINEDDTASSVPTYRCTACESIRLERAAALRKAVAIAERVARDNFRPDDVGTEIESEISDSARFALDALKAEVRDRALEEAASECDRHAKFCKDEAHKGGDFQHLITRADEATYNAERIRAMRGNLSGK